MATALLALLIGPTAHAGGGREVDVAPFANPVYRARDKKVIGFAWSCPSPSRLVDHMSDVEAATPYLDGIVFKLPETEPGAPPTWLPAFDRRPWTQDDVALPTLRRIRWNRLRHNFIALGPGATYESADASWFDDAAWATIGSNLRLLSRAVKESGARGVFFDSENYSGLWHYWHRESLRAAPPQRVCHYPGFTFAQVEAKVRQRGREFLSALRTHSPDVVLFASFLTSGSGSDPATVETSDFPLLRAFAAGLLDASGSRATLVEGLESTYWTASSDGYLWWHERLKDATAPIVPEDARGAWRTQSSTGMAVFYDALARGLYTSQLAVDAAYRRRWLEHNVYEAVLTNDEWTWLYFEKANPWADGVVAPEERGAIERGIESAREHRPLGFGMTARSLDLSRPSTFREGEVIRLRTPAPHAVFAAGRAVEVEVSTAGARPPLAVRVFVDSRPVVALHAAPWSVTLVGLSAGPHTLRAEAVLADDEGLALSPPVLIQCGHR